MKMRISIISHGKNGLIFSSQNVGDLGNCLEKLIKGPRFRISLGEVANAHVLSHYGIREIFPKFERLYRQFFANS